MTYFLNLVNPVVLAVVGLGPAPAADPPQKTPAAAPEGPVDPFSRRQLEPVERAGPLPTGKPQGREAASAPTGVSWDGEPTPPPPVTPPPESPDVEADPVPASSPEAPAPAAEPPPSPKVEPAPPRSNSVRRRAKVWPKKDIRYRIGALVAGGSHVISDQAYHGFDDNQGVPAFHVLLRADFRLASSRLFLGGGAGFSRFATDGQVYDGALNTELLAREAVFALRGSLRIIDGIDVYVEPSGGPSIVDVKLDTNTTTAQQRKVLGMVTGLAGFALYLPRRWLPRKGSARMSLGLDAGFGYTYRSKLQIQPGPDTDEDPISTSSADLGDVSLRGFTWRLGAFVHFM